MVPDLADITFASIVLAAPNPVRSVPGQIELCSGGITLALDSATDALCIAELAAGTAGRLVIFPSNRVRIMVATKPIDLPQGP